MTKQRIAIFASGTGSNAINLIRYFEGHSAIEIAFVLSNNSNAPILKSASAAGVKTINYSNREVNDGHLLVQTCLENKVDWVILAGYLRLIPIDFIKHYQNKIINLHPSLLPKYGGKGMFGQHVHEAVIENKEQESGITIHFVNQAFDEGRIIAQFHCLVNDQDDAFSLAKKIHVLEQNYLPKVVESTILNYNIHRL